MSKVKLVDNVQIIPGRLIVFGMVAKQGMPQRDIFAVEGGLSVFNSFSKKQIVLKDCLRVMKVKLNEKGDTCLWLPRKHIFFSKLSMAETVRTRNIILIYILEDFL